MTGLNLKSGINAITELIAEYRADEITSIYSSPNTGKSLFLISESVYWLTEGKKILYIDTEGGMDRMIETWKQRLIKRYGLTENEFDSNIKMITLRNSSEFFEYFGIKIERREKGEKIDLKFGKCKARVDKDIKTADVLIIDSFTMPFREFPTNRQNLPLRADVIGQLYFKLVQLQTRHTIPIILSHHLSLDPANPFSEKNMRGGDYLKHISKIVLYLSRFKQKKYENYRAVYLVRYPCYPDWSKKSFFRISDNGLDSVTDLDNLIVRENDNKDDKSEAPGDDNSSDAEVSNNEDINTNTTEG